MLDYIGLAQLIGSQRKSPFIEPDEEQDENGHMYDALERWHDRDQRARDHDDARRVHKSPYDTWH